MTEFVPPDARRVNDLQNGAIAAPECGGGTGGFNDTLGFLGRQYASMQASRLFRVFELGSGIECDTAFAFEEAKEAADRGENRVHVEFMDACVRRRAGW